MFGKRLKKLRENAELKQEELATKIGLSTSTIGMYENERRQPDYDTLLKISDFFDVSVDYLLGKTSVKKYEKPYDTELEEVLFSKAKDLSDEDKKAVMNVIDAIKRNIDNKDL